VEESLLDWLLGKPGRFLMTREKSLRKHIDHYSVCESATREPTEPVICLSVTKWRSFVQTNRLGMLSKPSDVGGPVGDVLGDRKRRRKSQQTCVCLIKNRDFTLAS